jgi:3'-phosphoadenosine 5'-phosphosulfate synthase
LYPYIITLCEQVAAGELKGFTGVDDPYEAPTQAELVIKNNDLTVQASVDIIMRRLVQEGVLVGAPTLPNGLPYPDGDEIVDLLVPVDKAARLRAEAETLPKALLTDIDVNWLQTVAEGWAAPLKGFMREGTLLQTMHFNSILVDPMNITGSKGINEAQTDFNDFKTVPPKRVSMSVPIVLPCTAYTKAAIESSGKKAVALVNKHGKTLAVLRNPEIYLNRKEETVARIFGVIDPGHPYIKHIYDGGDWLIGGEIELLEKVKYNDGLDQWRLTAPEVMKKFEEKGADAVFAFQTRNPTHAGHAYLMRTGREILLAKGYKNPILWLSPLGGWTKSDDVPLDVRVKQHEAVLGEKMLDPETTVMAIWPAPMIYAGPTEVLFHAKSRRNAGATYFVAGRDPAGMKGSPLALAHPDDDLYDGNHGRYVLTMSPGQDPMNILPFGQVYYDKRDHVMKAKDPTRPDDFIEISGSKMRKLAAQGAQPCDVSGGKSIPSDLLAANCIPPGFMVQSGWDIV